VFSKQDEHAAAALAFGKEVTVQAHSHDKYKRTIGEVILPDGMNLNQELVRKGWRWWYRKHVPWNTVLEGLERKRERGGKGCGPTRSRCRRGYLQKARVPTR
jgi:micrococcal nuclease